MNERKSFKGKVNQENAEEVLAHKRQLLKEAKARYRQKHKVKGFNVELSPEKYDAIDKFLTENGVTKKQFLEYAIDRFLEGNL